MDGIRFTKLDFWDFHCTAQLEDQPILEETTGVAAWMQAEIQSACAPQKSFK
jgi:hypothetical protein